MPILFPPLQAANVGESADFIPDEFSKEERVTGMWWRQLVAGGTAGAGQAWDTHWLIYIYSRFNILYVTSLKEMRGGSLFEERHVLSH